ncbi:MAG: hypothetical protein IJ062_04545 [Firmicutes bacterium]|nr:hypothetical protein [Bacillota bacterium]
MAYAALGLLILGIVFLLTEIFIPGFGVFGIMGLFSVAIAAVITVTTMENGIMIVVSGLVILAAIGYIAIEAAKKFGVYGKLVLKDTLDTDGEEQNVLNGLVGSDGVVKTPLKPHGKVDFGGTVTEAYCDGDFIPAGEKVVAYKVYANNLYVKKAE